MAKSVQKENIFVIQIRFHIKHCKLADVVINAFYKYFCLKVKIVFFNDKLKICSCKIKEQVIIDRDVRKFCNYFKYKIKN